MVRNPSSRYQSKISILPVIQFTFLTDHRHVKCECPSKILSGWSGVGAEVTSNLVAHRPKHACPYRVKIERVMAPLAAIPSPFPAPSSTPTFLVITYKRKTP